LCGYCDEALGSRRIVREPTEQRTYEVLLSLLGEQASAADLAAWTAAGRLLTENEAIDLALWR
jgi:hypothetical protein